MGEARSGVSRRMTAAYQEDNPELGFNEGLVRWREGDDPASYLEDVFRALEVVPGITFLGVEVERDESRFPPDLCHNDIEESRLDLARVGFRVEMGDESREVVLSIFLPKLVDGMFYVLNGSLYYPILQLVDRGTYVTRKTLTLKTLLMPLVLRRDEHAEPRDLGAPGAPARREHLFVLDLFRSRINVCTYLLARMGLAGAAEFLGGAAGDDCPIRVAPREDAEAAAASEPGAWRAYAADGPSGACVAAESWWADALDVPEGPARRDAALYRGGALATLAAALAGASRRAVEEDDPEQWRRRLGRHFTQNSNGFAEKADKILVSLERILDARTRKNLAHVAAEDKGDVYGVLRWMMREFGPLCRQDGMDLRSKRIRVSEYLVHPLLLKFSESTYRLLNSKSPTFKQLLGVFRPFVHDPEGGGQRPQVNFLVKKIVNQDLLRFNSLVNSFDLLLALRWTTRGPSSLGDRGRGDISLKYRGHHPSYVGRVSLSAASASDPGMSGTLVPFIRLDGQFIL